MKPGVTGMPTTRRRLLPADGNWHLTPEWRYLVNALAEPDEADAATRALVSVFTPEWASQLGSGERDVHPFEHWYGGGAALLYLGYCLHVLGVPESLARRLRVTTASDEDAADRFDAAAAEARAAALLLALGATVELIEERRVETKQPDLWARFGEQVTAVEVEQLDDGELDAKLARIDHAFWEGYRHGRAESLRESTHALHTSEMVQVPLVELERLARQTPPDVDAARTLGRRLGCRLAAHLAGSPAPGTYDLASSDGLDRHPSSGTCVAPVLRRVRDAAQHIASIASSGLLVLERRWPLVWPPGVHEGLRAEIQRGCHPEIAALLLRERASVVGASPTAEAITVLPGPRWAELPARLRDALPAPCGRCGLRHAVFDLLRWSPGAPPPWRPPGPVDMSRADATSIARATPPAVKLRQALEQMRVGFSLARANIRARHPHAGRMELDRAFRAWMLRDD